MSSSDEYKNPLPQPSRFITAHDKQGKSVFSTAVQETVNFWPIGFGTGRDTAGFGLGYTTSSFPTALNGDQDLDSFLQANEKKEELGLVRRGGSILRYVDIPPQSYPPMHRTVSLDYGFVLIGEIQCVLDSGEERTIKAGDVVVQRGTMHQWANKTDSWARMVFILLDATPINLEGVKFEEDLGDMTGLPDSH